MYLSSQLGNRGAYLMSAPLSRRRLARMGYLAAITADQAAQQAMPTSAISKTAGFTQTVYNDIEQAAQAGNFQEFNPTGCAGVKPSGATIVSGLAVTAGSLVLKFSGGNPIALGVGAALMVGGTIFTALFGHHAAAVAKERSVICAAVPAASDSLNAIYQAVQSGTITPQQAQQYLAGVLASFKQQVTSIIKMDSSHCNAACVWVKQLTAIVALQTSILQDQIDAAPAGVTALSPVTSAATNVATSLGIPPWVLYAAGGLLLYELL